MASLHSGTVVPECYELMRITLKVNEEIRNLTPYHPKTSESMVTKICMGDCVQSIYPCTKLHYDLIRKFCPAHMQSAYQMSTRLDFWVLTTRCTYLRLADFDLNTSKDVVSRKKVLLGVLKTKFYILTRFFKKTEIFGRFSMKHNFGSKEA